MSLTFFPALDAFPPTEMPYPGSLLGLFPCLISYFVLSVVSSLKRAQRDSVSPTNRKHPKLAGVE